uniref:Uncharacterized protein n=1 Tax=Oryza glumipatula TaxID=40148 RepID=A0A0D9YBA5_9ORYZ
MAACRHKMATLDGPVWGKGDPFFSLTLSPSNPTTWMESKHTEGRDSTLMVGRRRGVGAVAACRRGLAGGTVEPDMYALVRESRNSGESPASGPAMVTPAGAAFPLGRCCISFPLPMDSLGENHVLEIQDGRRRRTWRRSLLGGVVQKTHSLGVLWL